MVLFLLIEFIGLFLTVVSNAWLIYRLYASLYPDDIQSMYRMKKQLVVNLEDYFEVGLSWNGRYSLEPVSLNLIFVITISLIVWPILLLKSIIFHMTLFHMTLADDACWFEISSDHKLSAINTWYVRLHKHKYPKYYI